MTKLVTRVAAVRVATWAAQVAAMKVVTRAVAQVAVVRVATWAAQVVTQVAAVRVE